MMYMLIPISSFTGKRLTEITLKLLRVSNNDYEELGSATITLYHMKDKPRTLHATYSDGDRIVYEKNLVKFDNTPLLLASIMKDVVAFVYQDNDPIFLVLPTEDYIRFTTKLQKEEKEVELWQK